MSSPVLIIAEAGVNHNGDPDLARRLVDAAADAGADAVKFQTFLASELVRRDAPKARYQQETTGDHGSQWSMLKALELSRPLHFELKKRAQSRGIEFLSTAFDLPSLDFLIREVGVSRLKVPSGEITNAPLILAAARSRLPVILSTGMSSLADIEAALEVVAYGRIGGEILPQSRQQLSAMYNSPAARCDLAGSVTLLHCTSAYPAPAASANLKAMATLGSAFGIPVGYSDHTEGTAVSVAAVALGARVIEKHFTLDRNLEGPDHRASLEPAGLKQLVEEIRTVEAALGAGLKIVDDAEIENRPIARKSLVASRPIEAGEIFTTENLTAKRPEDGISPMEIWSFLGRRAPRPFETDSPVEL